MSLDVRHRIQWNFVSNWFVCAYRYAILLSPAIITVPRYQSNYINVYIERG